MAASDGEPPQQQVPAATHDKGAQGQQGPGNVEYFPPEQLTGVYLLGWTPALHQPFLGFMVATVMRSAVSKDHPITQYLQDSTGVALAGTTYR
jgi:hypothetical protein